MFSDRHRWIRLVFVALVLVGLGWRYTWLATHTPTGWTQCFDDPEPNDGREVIFPLYTVTRIVDEGRYEISKGTWGVPVLGATADLERGSTVSVLGTFEAERRVVIENHRQLHWLRPAKQVLGVLGLVMGIVGATMAFRWRSGHLEERSAPTRGAGGMTTSPTKGPHA